MLALKQCIPTYFKANHMRIVLHNFCNLSLVPSSSQWNPINPEKLPKKKVLSFQEIEYLESISLVQYKRTSLEKAILEDIIHFADSLQFVSTENVEPMVYVFEDEMLHLRKDVTTDTCAKSILKNAKVVTEGYFVAPPGNVALLESEKILRQQTND